jgi:hypothetical protein
MLSALFLCLIVFVSCTPLNQFSGYKVLRFTNLEDLGRKQITNTLDVRSMQPLTQDPLYENQLDLWSESVGLEADISFSPRALRDLKESLLDKLEHSVFILDVQEKIDSEAEHTRKHSFALSRKLATNSDDTIGKYEFFSDYQGYETIVQFWIDMSRTRDIQKVVVGQTYLGVDIIAFKFGTGPKSIVFHGGMHAREWIGPAAVSYMGVKLETEPEYEDLRKAFTFYVIPNIG